MILEVALTEMKTDCQDSLSIVTILFHLLTQVCSSVKDMLTKSEGFHPIRISLSLTKVMSQFLVKSLLYKAFRSLKHFKISL